MATTPEVMLMSSRRHTVKGLVLRLSWPRGATRCR
jgi:hypothetical protein